MPKAVCSVGLLFEDAKKDVFIWSQVLPRKARKSSRLFWEWARLPTESYPDQFFRFSRVAVAKISDKLIFQLCSQKTDSWSKIRLLCLMKFLFLPRKLKNELVWKLATVIIDKRETGLGISPKVVKLIPRKVGSIYSLYGVKPKLKAKKTLFATFKKSSITNGITWGS